MVTVASFNKDFIDIYGAKYTFTWQHYGNCWYSHDGSLTIWSANGTPIKTISCSFRRAKKLARKLFNI